MDYWSIMETKEGKKEKMKSIRSVKLGLPTITLIALLTAGAVGATIFFTLEVPSTVVVMSYEIQFWNEDKTAVVTSFDFGQINPSESAYSEIVWVENAGDTEIWYDWFCDDLPVGLELIAEDSYDGVDWGVSPWSQGSLRGSGRNPTDGGILAGEFGNLMIRFKVTHTNTVSGTLSFTIKVNSHDSATG